jgi:maltose O-acetyltransferase
MTSFVRRAIKFAAEPRTVLALLNAQAHLGWRADVPVSVRLFGRVQVVAAGQIVLGRGVVLKGSVVPIELIAMNRAVLKIGDQSFLNYGCSISAHQEVSIGRRCKLGHYVMVLDNQQHSVGNHLELPPSAPVEIEDDVWIGSRAIVLPGVRIGRRAVVGAGSVVTRDVPANTVVAGNPARVIREIEDWAGEGQNKEF